ncbi:MAG: hypothetical protein V7608_6597 [Hyphomicrobiales bacterium]|jgi:glycosyltransferase involved in cell wall biosynthesis
MKFLCVTHFFESHGGGIERVAGHLNRHIAHAGHDVCWAASAADPAPCDAAVKVLPLRCINPLEKFTGLPMPIPMASACVTMRQAVRWSDVIVIHDALYMTSLLAMMFAIMARKPVVLIQHIAEIEFAHPVMRWLMRLANRLVTRPVLGMADQTIFISNTVREAFADMQMKRAALLLFNGVDTEIFRVAPGIDRAAVRGSHGLPPAGTLAVFVGRFVKKKGMAVLQELARQRSEISFVLVGTGPIDPRRWRLPNIHVLGTLQPAALAELYHAADFLVLPSVGEGYPLVIQEAMVCGLSVICGKESARADPAASRWLHGVVIDLSDPAGSAACVAGALDAGMLVDGERRQMASYAASAYSWPTMAAAIAALSHRLIAAR